MESINQTLSVLTERTNFAQMQINGLQDDIITIKSENTSNTSNTSTTTNASTKVYFFASANPYNAEIPGNHAWRTVVSWSQGAVSAIGMFTNGANVFTAPETAVYCISAYATISGNNHTSSHMEILQMRSGTQQAILIKTSDSESNDVTTKYRNHSGTVIVELQQNDALQMQLAGDNGTIIAAAAMAGLSVFKVS